MSNYSIIEDASPYFIRMNIDGLGKLISFILDKESSIQHYDSYFGVKGELAYMHKTFTQEISRQILDMLPLSQIFSFKTDRVSIFETPAFGGCGIHKDGAADRVSFNIALEIKDENCLTSWYDDKDFEDFKFINLPYSRNVYRDFNNLNKFNPVKTMVAHQNEMIIFNTDIFHAWRNASMLTRKVLTLRTVDCNTLTFDMVKEKLFPNI